VLAKQKIPAVQNGNILACSVALLGQCVECSVFDFLHLAFPAEFAWDPLATVPAAPSSVHVAAPSLVHMVL